MSRLGGERACGEPGTRVPAAGGHSVVFPRCSTLNPGVESETLGNLIVEDFGSDFSTSFFLGVNPN